MLSMLGLFLVLWPCSSQEEKFNAGSMPLPVIEGEWWTIAGNPDLGPLNAEGQFPTAFGIWQAADGSWQLLSCVRGTGIGGKTRLLHRWQGSSLAESNWNAMGVLLTADTAFNETAGGLQAPFVLKQPDSYFLFYGDWENICLARSEDGKTFARKLSPEGKSAIYSHGPGINTKDPFIIMIGDIFHLYYAAVRDENAAIYCSLTEDLISWTEPRKVSSGDTAGNGPESAESPNLVYLPEAGVYYLFRSHKSTETGNFVTTVYASADPLDFGPGSDAKRICTLPVEGIRIIYHNNTYFIASLMPGLTGTRMARLKWELIK